MDVYTTEDEQLAAVKSWFQHYGFKALLAVAVIAAAFFGYHYNQSQKHAGLEKASILYTQLVRVTDQGVDTKESRQMFDEIYGYLSTDFKDSIYATYAALMRASLDVKENDYEKAEQTLEWILSRKNAPEVSDLARLRLARVKASNNGMDEALVLLDQGSTFYPSEYAEAKGDILRLQNKPEEALKAYELAKATSHNKRPGTILDLKINALKKDPAELMTIKP